jgi:hypothetical protein
MCLEWISLVLLLTGASRRMLLLLMVVDLFCVIDGCWFVLCYWWLLICSVLFVLRYLFCFFRSYSQICLFWLKFLFDFVISVSLLRSQHEMDDTRFNKRYSQSIASPFAQFVDFKIWYWTRPGWMAVVQSPFSRTAWGDTWLWSSLDCRYAIFLI